MIRTSLCTRALKPSTLTCHQMPQVTAKRAFNRPLI